MKIDQKTTHSRTTTIRLDSKQLSDLIVRAAVAGLERPDRPNIDRKGVSAIVRFEDETEGSPAYKIGTKAVISIVEDLSPDVCGDE